MWGRLSATLWQPDFWLPLGVTWDDLRSTDSFHFPVFSDVWIYPPAFGLCLMLFRFSFLEPRLFRPLARSMGVSDWRPAPPAFDAALEALYRRYQTKVPAQVIVETSEANKLSPRQVQRWLNRKHAVTKSTKYEKFMDCAYDFSCHTFMCIFGFVVMVSKPWLWNITLCWRDYPHHSISTDVWWYYMLCLAYFWSTTIIQIPKPAHRISDKVQMMSHHLFTILLMVFSWTCNFVRVGTLVLVVHECADVPLQAAKIFKHAGIDRLTDVMFAVFVILWLATRCCVFPLWIMYSVFFEATTFMFMPSAYLFMGLLVGLLILNLGWTWIILSIVIRKLRAGTLQDVRSSGEEESEDESQMSNGIKKE